MPELDRWLSQLFAPENLDDTVAQMLGASDSSEGDDAKVDAARRKLADCDDRLGKYRAALDSGADPVVVTGWKSEVQSDRLAAEAVLAAAAPSEPLSAAALRSIIEELGDMAQVLAEADAKDKAEVYAGLGIEVTYRPDQGLVSATARPPVGVQQSVSKRGLLREVHRSIRRGGPRIGRRKDRLRTVRDEMDSYSRCRWYPGLPLRSSPDDPTKNVGHPLTSGLAR